MSTDNKFYESPWECDHPGCAESVEIRSYKPVPDSDLASIMTALSWLVKYRNGKLSEAFCTGCRKAHE
jgi:hypothetical protein